MSTGVTEDEVDRRLLGICPHCHVVTPTYDRDAHASDCPEALGTGTAWGDVVIDGERCSGPCGMPLAAGETYQATEDDGLWCVACAALRDPSTTTHDPGDGGR